MEVQFPVAVKCLSVTLLDQSVKLFGKHPDFGYDFLWFFWCFRGGSSGFVMKDFVLHGSDVFEAPAKVKFVIVRQSELRNNFVLVIENQIACRFDPPIRYDEIPVQNLIEGKNPQFHFAIFILNEVLNFLIGLKNIEFFGIQHLVNFSETRQFLIEI